MSPASFKATEKLKSRKIIASLFSEGRAISAYPLRAIWLKVDAPEQAFPARFALTVPRRAFPKAVHRNVLRRRIREAYRLHKAAFYQSLPNAAPTAPQLAFMVIYLAKEPLPYSDIEAAMQRLLGKLAKA